MTESNYHPTIIEARAVSSKVTALFKEIFSVGVGVERNDDNRGYRVVVHAIDEDGLEAIKSRNLTAVIDGVEIRNLGLVKGPSLTVVGIAP